MIVVREPSASADCVLECDPARFVRVYESTKSQEGLSSSCCAGLANNVPGFERAAGR